MINTELDIDYSDLHWGKYDCPMAQYISVQVMGNGDFGEDEWTNEMGDGFTRYGRRVFSWDDRGFVYCDTYNTVEEAQEVVRQAWVRIEAAQDEQCKEQGCVPCPFCSRYDCGSCQSAVDGVYAGSDHIGGCEREWIG